MLNYSYSFMTFMTSGAELTVDICSSHSSLGRSFKFTTEKDVVCYLETHYSHDSVFLFCIRHCSCKHPACTPGVIREFFVCMHASFANIIIRNLWIIIV